jgi:hypothetical protein
MRAARLNSPIRSFVCHCRHAEEIDCPVSTDTQEERILSAAPKEKGCGGKKRQLLARCQVVLLAPQEQTCDYCSIILLTSAFGKCVFQSLHSPDPRGMDIPYFNRQLLQVTLRQDAPRIDEDNCTSMNAENSQLIYR